MSILIIGSTGYLGKSLLETLLRNKYSGKIYLMIREKKGKTIEERFKIMLNSVCFKNVSFEDYDITLINGDLQNNVIIPYEIDIIVNCAASISFTLPLKEAYQSNTAIIQNLKKIANDVKCKKLIHISTAYVNHSIDQNNNSGVEELINIDECFQTDLKLHHVSDDLDDIDDMRLNTERVLQLYNIDKLCRDIQNDNISFEDIQKATGFPNTYTFTKCLAEHILMNNVVYSKENCYIIRPSAIMGAYQYPTPGWTESYGAGNGYYALFLSGSVTVLSTEPDSLKQVNFIPVDLVSKSIYKIITTDNNKHIKHCVSDPIMNGPYAMEYLRRINSLYYDSQYFPYFVIRNITWFNIFVNLFDLSRLYFMLFFVKMMIFFSNSEKYKKQERLLSVIITSVRTLRYNYSHFLDKKYRFDIEDREYLDNFDMENYISIFTEGINQYLLRKKRKMNLFHKNRNIVSFISKIMLQLHFGIFFFTSLFSNMVGFILGRCYQSITIEYKNMPELINNWDHQYVIVSNHRSHMDSIIIKYVLDANPGLLVKNPYILITKELMNIPVLSKLIKLTKTISIDRKNPDKIALTNDIDYVLSSGNNLIFYPEGTRSRSNMMLPFKKGVFSAIHKYDGPGNIKILPISISYQMIPEYESFKESFKSVEKGNEPVKPTFSFVETIKWIWITLIHGRNYGDVKVTIGNPINIKDYSFDEMISKTEREIRNNLEYQSSIIDNPDDIDNKLWKKID